MENPSEKQLKSITSNFQKILECPVCLNLLTYPFKWCANGHSICSECVDSLEECPTCRVPLRNENITLPLCLKNLLEALPRFCCYSEAGCEAVVEEKDDHEKFCGFRPFHCKAPDCDVTVPLCKLMSHIEKEHQGTYSEKLIVTENKVQKWYVNKSASGAKQFHDPVYLFNNWLWLTINKEVDGLEFCYYVTPIGNPVDDYFIRVIFKKGDEVYYSNTLKAYDISSCSIKEFEDWHSVSNNDDSDDLFFKLTVPYSLMKYCQSGERLEIVSEYVFFTVPKQDLLD